MLDTKVRLTEDERLIVDDACAKPRLRLEVRTATDVDWATINTADSSTDRTKRSYAVRKLRDLWYNGLHAQHPSGTEWRIRDDYF